VSVARLSSPRSWLAPALSGALLGLAAMTKLPSAAAPIALATGLYLVVVARWRSVAFFAALLASCGMIVLLLGLQSGAWPLWYMLQLPLRHTLARDLIGRFWWSDVLPHATLPLILGPLFVVGAAVRREQRVALFWVLATLSLLGVAWASRANGGGAPNVLLPGFAALALLFGLGLSEARRQLGTRALQVYVLGVGIAQLALLGYDPRAVVPYSANRRADDQVAAALAPLTGPIFAPDFAGYLPPDERQRQPLMSAVSELWGIYGGGATEQGDQWRQALRDQFRQHRFRAVVLEVHDCCLKELMEGAGYIQRGPMIPESDNFYAWRNARTPEPVLYVSPEAADAAPGAAAR
jgi:hypothetical protein